MHLREEADQDGRHAVRPSDLSARERPQRAAPRCPRGADLTAKLVRIGDGDDFVAIGGHVALDSERGWMFADVLPPVFHIDGSSIEASTMRYFRDQLVKEVASKQPGTGLMSEQLTQLLFVQTMRSHLSTACAGLDQVLRDARLAPALRLKHQKPSRPWRVDELAGCGMAIA